MLDNVSFCNSLANEANLIPSRNIYVLLFIKEWYFDICIHTILLLRWYFFLSMISVFHFLIVKQTDPYVINAGINCRKLKAGRRDETVTKITFPGQWNQRIPTLKTKINLETTTFMQLISGSHHASLLSVTFINQLMHSIITVVDIKVYVV